jgi:C-terminal processing protease CtpA/Prc
LALFPLFLLLAESAPAARNSIPTELNKTAVARLVHLCKLFNFVRYFHPYLAYKQIDWDKALLQAIPRVIAAGDPVEFQAAVDEMLRALDDPLTRTRIQRSWDEAAAAQKRSPLYEWIDSSTLLIRIPRIDDVAASIGASTSILTLNAELGKAEAVIFDLPEHSGRVSDADLHDFPYRRLNGLEPSVPMVVPGQRGILHFGYHPASRGYSGYASSFSNPYHQALTPVSGKPLKAAFLARSGATIPAIALALADSGDAIIVSEGQLTEAQFAEKKAIPLGEGLEAVVRTSELDYRGRHGLQADFVVGEGRDPVTAAHQRLKSSPQGTTRPAVVAAPLPAGNWRPDAEYKDMQFPAFEYRLLAAFRIWGVIRYFYPYMHLITENWDQVLEDFIVRFQRAQTAEDYALTVAEMATHVPDGHTTVIGTPSLATLRGEAGPPFSVRWVENAYVITALIDGAACQKAGVALGDVLVAIDGEPVATRAEHFGRYTAASTPAAHRYKIGALFTRGKDGTTLKLRLRGGDAKVKAAAVPRSKTYASAPLAPEMVRLLEDGIGYVDLTRLTTAEVDAMFERFKETKAIILDVRGYPKGTAWVIAPRLNTRNARDGAMYLQPLVSASDEDARKTFFQMIPATDKWRYTGRTVMLMDERTASQAEHTGLFFEAANGTKFIGSHTAGANGDVTTFTLPGGIVFYFTGHDVRHADGRQLQRIGLVPDVEVKPTIAGIRSGRDEVLERATQYLREPERARQSKGE